MGRVDGPSIQQDWAKSGSGAWQAKVTASDGRVYTLETKHPKNEERNAMLRQFMKDISNENSNLSKVLQPGKKTFVDYTFTGGGLFRKVKAAFEQGVFKTGRTAHLEISQETRATPQSQQPISRQPGTLAPLQRRLLSQAPAREGLAGSAQKPQATSVKSGPDSQGKVSETPTLPPQGTIERPKPAPWQKIPEGQRALRGGKLGETAPQETERPKPTPRQQVPEGQRALRQGKFRGGASQEQVESTEEKLPPLAFEVAEKELGTVRIQPEVPDLEPIPLPETELTFVRYTPPQGEEEKTKEASSPTQEKPSVE